MPAKRLTLILDDETRRRFEAFARRAGLDEGAALDHALRSFLDADDKAQMARDVMLAAARDGEATAAYGVAADHDEVRRWLASWGTDLEKKRPRSC